MKIQPLYYAIALHQALTENPKEQKRVAERFVALIISRQLQGQLEQIMAAFQRYDNQVNNTTAVEIIAAHEVSAKTIEEIKQALEKITETKVAVQLQLDPALLGGLLLKFNDTVIDSTLRQQLATLRQRLSSAY